MSINLLFLNHQVKNENHLQQSSYHLNDKTKKFEERLEKISKNFKMSGSGSCYYLLTGKDNSQKLYEKMKSEFSDCFISLVDFI